jgi:hypothetical protein
MTPPGRVFVARVPWVLVPRPHHRQRSRAYGFDPVGFSFAIVRSVDVLALPVLNCNRFCRPRKSSGPPLFAPSLKIQGDDAHDHSVIDDLTLGRQTASRSRANGGGRNCVPNKDGADFQEVLESGHTMGAARGFGPALNPGRQGRIFGRE